MKNTQEGQMGKKLFAIELQPAGTEFQPSPLIQVRAGEPDKGESLATVTDSRALSHSK
ncbi:MAG: hypothetical protein Q9211_002402 [Gyalolechia sp. 1 TL-2023]